MGVEEGQRDSQCQGQARGQLLEQPQVSARKALPQEIYQSSSKTLLSLNDDELSGLSKKLEFEKSLMTASSGHKIVV